MSRSVAELKKLALNQRQTFHRTVATEVYLTEEGALVVAKLHDNYHDMEMAVLVDRDTYVVKDISAVMHRYPFDTCVFSWNSYKRLIGLKLMGGGVLHKIHNMIPRVDGCTHLYVALEACLRALFIGSGYEDLKSNANEEDHKRHQNMLRQHPLTKDTCVSFRNDEKFPEEAEAISEESTSR